MALPVRRTTRTVVHIGVVTGLTALVAAVFGTVGELTAVGVTAIVVIVVGAYVLSRP
jgi:hypothetical protein